MNIFHERFSTGQVIKAAAITNETLQTWLKRGLIVGHGASKIEGAGSPGIRRSFSFHNVIEFAVGKALFDVGLKDLPHAMAAASSFAHGSNGARLPGLPFDRRSDAGMTLLCVAGQRSTEVMFKPGTSDFYTTARHVLGTPSGFVSLEIDPLCERVVAALGYAYRDVLALAYGPVAA